MSGLGNSGLQKPAGRTGDFGGAAGGAAVGVAAGSGADADFYTMVSFLKKYMPVQSGIDDIGTLTLLSDINGTLDRGEDLDGFLYDMHGFGARVFIMTGRPRQNMSFRITQKLGMDRKAEWLIEKPLLENLQSCVQGSQAVLVFDDESLLRGMLSTRIKTFFGIESQGFDPEDPALQVFLSAWAKLTQAQKIQALSGSCGAAPDAGACQVEGPRSGVESPS